MDTQDAPIQDGSGEAGIDEKIAGVAQQLRGDDGMGHVDDLAATARQRLAEANLPTDDATVAAVVDAARRD